MAGFTVADHSICATFGWKSKQVLKPPKPYLIRPVKWLAYC